MACCLSLMLVLFCLPTINTRVHTLEYKYEPCLYAKRTLRSEEVRVCDALLVDNHVSLEFVELTSDVLDHLWTELVA